MTAASLDVGWDLLALLRSRLIAGTARLNAAQLGSTLCSKTGDGKANQHGSVWPKVLVDKWMTVSLELAPASHKTDAVFFMA